MLSESDMAIIDVVLAAYDGMSGKELEDLTHIEELWLVCFNQLTGVNALAVISHGRMRSYYARLLTSTDEEQRHHHVPNFNHPKKLYVTSGD